MFGIIAAVVSGVNFILIGVGATTSAWFSPVALLALALFFLALHLSGVGSSWRVTRS